MTTREKIANLVSEAEPDVRQAMAKVYALEKQFIYQPNPRGVREQVLEVFKQAIR